MRVETTTEYGLVRWDFSTTTDNGDVVTLTVSLPMWGEALMAKLLLSRDVRRFLKKKASL